MARTLRTFLARYPGLSPDALLDDAGIGPKELADPEASLVFARTVALFERAAQETGDEAIGLAFMQQVPWADLGVLGYVVLHAATLGAALGNACRYHAIQQSSAGTALEVGPEVSRLSYAPGDVSIGPHAQHSEIVLGTYARVCREAVGFEAWGPREVRFRHRAPTDASAQRHYFRAPVYFGQAEDALVIATADLRAPMKAADPGLLPILVRHADECLKKLPGGGDDFRDSVRRVVIAALGSGDVSIEHVAARLGMSGRSVQRKLQEDGQSFKELVAETRLALSRRYLGDPSLSLTEAAFLLGYSDLSAFSRAFRRWTGASAIEFRKRARQRS